MMIDEELETMPVVLNRPQNGEAVFIAFIWRIKHPDRPSDWYLYEVRTKEVRRICDY